jgi:ABC-type Fe3+-hydroxamate transport system substrate-binding protein
MPYYTDQANRSVSIKSPPTRIISLVPSQTELLSDLGLEASVIGITKFCIHPEHWFRSKQRVGGTKNPDLQLIYSLQPDLIIGNKEENRKEDIETLAAFFPVWLSDINNLEEALQMIEQISEITATTAKGETIIRNIRDAFARLRSSFRSPPSKQSHSAKNEDSREQNFRICYLIWQDPYIAVANHTFIDSMIQECGFENVFAGKSRYPVITDEEIRSSNCDFIFLSTEPYPFTERHQSEMKSSFPGSTIMLVEGEPFSWYGSRLSTSAPYFQSLINKLHYAAGTK